MASGLSNQAVQRTGEYLVAAELSRAGCLATTFSGTVPDYDLLVVTPKDKTVRVQVKTIRGKTWQFGDARRYLRITYDKRTGRQTYRGKGELPRPWMPGMPCVFVKLADRNHGQAEDEFHLLRLWQLQDLLAKGYRAVLKRLGGRKPQNPESYHHAFSVKDLARFKDKWHIILGRQPAKPAKTQRRPAKAMDRRSG